MVSLRSSASSPSSLRSNSRTNTPEPDQPTTSKHRTMRTYSGANKRKSSRLSQSSVPPSDPSDEKATSKGSSSTTSSDRRRRSSKTGSAVDEDDETNDIDSRTEANEQQNGNVEDDSSENRDDAEEEKQPLDVEAEEAKQILEDVEVDGPVREDQTPGSEDAEMASVSSEEPRKAADALALVEAEKYMAKSSKRRRTSQPVVDLSTDEDEEEEEVEEKGTDKMGEGEEPGREDEEPTGAKPEVAKVENESKKAAKKKPAPVKKAATRSKAPLKKVVANPSSPAPRTNQAAPDSTESTTVAAPASSSSTKAPQTASLSASSKAPLNASLELSSRTRRKRSASPIVTKPGKRPKSMTESQLKKSTLAESDTRLRCFEVIVFGDANAAVQVSIPARNRPRLSLVPELLSIHPFTVTRSSLPDKTKPKATFTAYRFPLPDRGHHESFDKVRIKIYGKTVKAPSTRDGFVNRTFEDGQVAWKLEADEERCRWKQDRVE